MKGTYQTEGLDIYQHGLLVWKYARRLLNIRNDSLLTDMKIPDWFLENREEIICQTHNKRNIIKTYTIFHDLGKPRCLQIDEATNKRHFPNHAAISEQIWNQELCNGSEDSKLIGKLIGLDMIFHTETPEQIIARNLDRQTICILLLSALSELHANAQMFGGISSESFCIKYKRLNKRAKKILTM